MSGLFISGTGTGVGKTFVTCLIAKALAAAGKKVGVYKPAASGCDVVDGKIMCLDAVSLWDAAGQHGDLDRACPQAFIAELAPPRAAAIEGRKVDIELLKSGVDYWKQNSDIVLVEGAGGLFSPIADQWLNAHLAAELGYPLVIVAPNALGTIHGTLATLGAARDFDKRLNVIGIVLNGTADPAIDASCATNAADLALFSNVPLLATVDRGGIAFNAEVDWHALAQDVCG